MVLACRIFKPCLSLLPQKSFSIVFEIGVLDGSHTQSSGMEFIEKRYVSGFKHTVVLPATFWHFSHSS